MILLLAFCDTIASAALALSLPLDVVYLLTLVTKLSLLPFFHLRNPIGDWRFTGFIALFIVCLLLSLVHGENETQTMRLLAYFAHMGCSVLLLRPALFRRYITLVSAIITAYAAIYLMFNAVGIIRYVSGRATFFGGSHPNLGGEILMLAVPLAALLNQRRLVLLGATTTLPALLFLQSRAAFLVAASALLIWLLRITFEKRRSIGGVLLIGGLFICGTLLVFSPTLITETVLRLDDPYRGGGTGFVGRDARWDQAWTLFSQSPFIGVGLTYFEDSGIDSPHNFVLYALSTMGIFGVGVLILFGGGLLSIARRDLWAGLCLSTLLIAVLFNDRFLNLNAYPFIFQLLLLAFDPAARSTDESLITKSDMRLSNSA